ncbi:MAG: class I SAM-dependent methyltransferase [Patescibacteria group bacterium]
MDYDAYYSQWYSKKNSNKHYAHIYLEKPAMKKILFGRVFDSVLDLGCASGDDLEWLKDHSLSIKGLDSSKGLLDIAQFNYPQIKFYLQDLNTNKTLNDKYDLIYSSLTLHYIEDWKSLFEEFYNKLNENGVLLFSTHHPIKWGSRSNKNSEFNEFVMGYKKSKKEKTDKSFEIYGDYLNTYPIKEKLFQQLEITHYNRSLSEMFKIFVESGFEVKQFIEPIPTEDSKSIVRDFYEVHSRIPLFVIFELKKINR